MSDQINHHRRRFLGMAYVKRVTLIGANKPAGAPRARRRAAPRGLDMRRRMDYHRAVRGLTLVGGMNLRRLTVPHPPDHA
jgi:hypothetical protein